MNAKAWRVAALFLACPGAALPAAPERLKSQPGGAPVLAAIEAAGGWQAWLEKKTVRYERVSTRFDKDKVIRDRGVHHFTLPPEARVRQESEREGKRILILFDGARATVTEDGQPVTDPARVASGRNSSFGTQYLFCLPWKLAEDGSRLESLGSQRIGAAEYDVVRITYPPGAGDNPDHVWTAYFNRKTRLMERVDWSNAANTSHSISEYSDFRRTQGLLWPFRRANYGRAPDGSRGSKITDLVYRNIRFNVPMESGAAR